MGKVEGTINKFVEAVSKNGKNYVRMTVGKVTLFCWKDVDVLKIDYKEGDNVICEYKTNNGFNNMESIKKKKVIVDKKEVSLIEKLMKHLDGDVMQEGLVVEWLMKNSKLSEEKCNELIEKLISQGDLFYPTPGSIARL